MSTAPAQTVFDLITDFLIAEPTTDEILAYRLPDELEERARYLLRRQREASLTTDEELELHDFIRADDMMTLLKAKARLRLSGQH